MAREDTSPHQITPGVPKDPSIESNPKSTNRAHKAAPMPEVCGRSIKDGTMSGGGSAGHRTFGSGKGGLKKSDRPGKSAEQGKERQ